MASHPAPITREEAQERHSPHRSGFAAPGYWTEERKQKQREWAKVRIAEGRFGGKPGQGGRPRVKSATEVIAERAAANGDKIAKRLVDIAVGNPDPRRAIEAMDRLTAAEQTVAKNQREDERELLNMEGDELNELMMERLKELTGESFDAEASSEEVSDEDADQFLLELEEHEEYSGDAAQSG